MTMSLYDYIIVGGGPAGCALACRLAERRARARIVLLEAGPEHAGRVSDIPLGLALHVPRKSARNYAYTTVPQPGLNGRRGFQPRGRGLGGSSLINAMVYVRGQPQDYDGWAREAGCEGWSWQDVLPVFKRAEHNERGADALHGTGGPLNVADLRTPNPVAAAFLDAAVEAGFVRNRDFNGPTQEGVGFYQVTQKNGERCHAGRAYLRPRPNLTVLANCQVERIVFAGRRAAGVVIRRGGRTQTLEANAEIIVCAGAFGSPQLLMCSGIGPAGHLRALGIEVVRDSPEVGGNLQDHIDYAISRRVASRDLVGLTPSMLPQIWRGWRQFKRQRSGLMTSNIAEAGGFLKTHPRLDRPDIQLHFCIALVDDHGRKAHLTRGYSVHVCVLRPKSRGTVRLAAADMRTPPLINPQFLSDPEDVETLVRGTMLVRGILRARPMMPFAGRAVHDGEDAEEEELRAVIRARADTIYHPAGTCRMGGDSRAVLDPQLRVRGVDKLRVADASIMPTLVSGNTQAPSGMIGERAADLLCQDIAPAARVAPATSGLNIGSGEPSL
jgi:choline dehydrogenase-like flavoprotein